MQDTQTLATSRRTLLGCAAALAVPAGAAAAAVEADPHPAWLAAILELRDRINTGGLTEEQSDQLFDEKCELEDRLYERQAQTLAGLRAQIAGAVQAVDRGTFNEEIEGLGLRNALATLDMLAGRA